MRINWHLEKLEDAGEESWVLSFLDLITLMLTLFVILLTYSSFDKPSYETLTEEISSKFKKNIKQQQSSDGEHTSKKDGLKYDLSLPASLKNTLQVQWFNNTAHVEINSDLLFLSGSSHLSYKGKQVFEELLPVVINHEGTIIVEGHTDDIPIKNEIFPSNWELSASRAASVVRYMIDQGASNQKFKIIGYADTKPIDNSKTDKARSKNRRVKLILEFN